MEKKTNCNNTSEKRYKYPVIKMKCSENRPRTVNCFLKVVTSFIIKRKLIKIQMACMLKRKGILDKEQAC